MSAARPWVRRGSRQVLRQASRQVSPQAWRRLLRRLALGAAAAVPGLASAYSCTAGATAFAFGVYSATAVLPDDATGSLTIQCTANLVSMPLNFTIALSSGGSGSYAPRRMAAGASTLQYQLYIDPARLMVWGDGTAGTSVVNGIVVLSLSLPVSATYTVYGRMPAGQSGATAGSYADSIIMTVSY